MTTDLILGTAGHIDHGKTTLIKALTGTDTDRLPEEKQRGITIELGFAELNVGDFRFTRSPRTLALTNPRIQKKALDASVIDGVFASYDLSSNPTAPRSSKPVTP